MKSLFTFVFAATLMGAGFAAAAHENNHSGHGDSHATHKSSAGHSLEQHKNFCKGKSYQECLAAKKSGHHGEHSNATHKCSAGHSLEQHKKLCKGKSYQECLAAKKSGHHGEHSNATPEGLKLSGFVEAVYVSVPNHDESSFVLEQAELDIEKEIGGIGGFRIDLQHLEGEEVTGDAVMEQGYVYVDAGITTLTLGKFNAPIGFELLDPNEMYQFSHAQVFDYGLPTNLTGLMLSHDYGSVDYNLYVVNGWDNNQDDNTDKTIGGRIGYKGIENLTVGLSYITGNENLTTIVGISEGSQGESSGGHRSLAAEGAATETGRLSVFDVDLKYELGHHAFIGGEFNSGTFEKGSLIHAGEDATWDAWMVVAHVVYPNNLGLTLRYDSFHDKQGARFGNALDETRNALTIAPLYHLSEELELLAEYKLTTSNQKTFQDKDGNAKDSQSSFAFKALYSF